MDRWLISLPYYQLNGVNFNEGVPRSRLQLAEHVLYCAAGLSKPWWITQTSIGTVEYMGHDDWHLVSEGMQRLP